MPEAITGRELFNKLAALTKEELDLPVMLDSHCCTGSCIGLELNVEAPQLYGLIPPYILLTRSDG